jgi:hypothetical protein
MFFDLGAYGVPEKVRRKEPWDAKAAIRAMEKYTRDVGGYQVCVDVCVCVCVCVCEQGLVCFWCAGMAVWLAGWLAG